ncbi:MAG: SRPBCC family protein [Myxococcota bacterium]
MKIVRYIAIAVAVVVALFLVTTLFLPTEVHVERSMVIEASPETLYDFVDSYERFGEWSPWAELDPNMKVALEGPESGVGHIQRWESVETGNGSQEIIETDAPRMVKSRLDFGFGEPPVATWVFAKAEGGTQATWSLDSTFESDYIGRYFGLKLDDWVGTDYERGLAKLKEVAEAEQKKRDAEVAAAEPEAEAEQDATPAID